MWIIFRDDPGIGCSDSWIDIGSIAAFRLRAFQCFLTGSLPSAQLNPRPTMENFEKGVRCCYNPHKQTDLPTALKKMSLVWNQLWYSHLVHDFVELVAI